MSLAGVFVFLIVLGVCTWAATTYIPMPQAFKTIILVLAIIVALYYVLAVTGILGSFRSIAVPTVK